ncbi:NAD/NADP octopine/nopaline dehydrogenase family protein [Tenacibaculum soleae]|uniref:NAD/NADP octopine/nopaline dehydrogenase family protein n=1 Tax=Tenacibaculum soleae TaxID=447689 RepID=UPI002300BE2D|nr:NAD/NADP octopine/nopaline dehydrogenase family protein [Tenacibaculum soleae]
MIKETITIVGGGSSAHVLIPFLTNSSRSINLYTRQPDKWQNKIETELQNNEGEVLKTYYGDIDKISNDPKDVITQADIIILCMPVYKYYEAMESIAPHIKKGNVLLGTIYGQGGVNWMIESIKEKFNLINLNYFAVGLIPWIARTKEYGKKGITYGAKTSNCVAFNKSGEFDKRKEFLNDLCYNTFGKGKFVEAKNFISLTLSVDNQIIHPSRMYGLFLKDGGKWENEDKVPFFYKDYDELSADLLKGLDRDYSLIRERIKTIFKEINFEYMLDYLSLERFSYGSENTDIKSSFVKSETLGAIKTPVQSNDNGFFELNKNHRFFFDDIYNGIIIAKWFSEKLDIKVKVIDEILRWSEVMLNDRFLTDEGKINYENKKLGFPNYYGINKIEEAIK